MIVITIFASSFTKIHPGLVFIPNMLTIDEQKELANIDSLCLVEEKNRVRMYDSLQNYPKIHKNVYKRYIDKAREVDNELPRCIPTHCLTNFYKSYDGLVWHRDIYENDGDSDYTIFNLSIGAPAIFGYELDDKKYSIKLCSGDGILFGGECRFLHHAIERVFIDESPDWMKTPGRLSYTYRDSVSMFGREEEFKTFDVLNDNFKESQERWSG
jgi:hypothetical protein